MNAGEAIEIKRMFTPVNEKILFGKTILVAEDVEMNQQLIWHILESNGAHVVIARNGAEALEQVKKQIFDCVLMDVQMPVMDGIMATEQIRNLADPLLSAIPIIALTANFNSADLIKYEKAGMDDFLAKPVVEANLLNTILSYSGELKSGKNGDHQILYDLSMIQSVSGGDDAFIKKMIRLFIQTVPQNVQELVDATNNGNWEQVSKMAHKLKSTIDSMGIRSVHDVIRTIEMHAKNRDQLDRIPELVKQVESVVSACISQLQSEIE
jgi:CheY-like chemotaxis protein/HPt (histidine-containing phosphotransfer) domain-containing protein